MAEGNDFWRDFNFGDAGKDWKRFWSGDAPSYDARYMLESIWSSPYGQFAVDPFIFYGGSTVYPRNSDGMYSPYDPTLVAKMKQWLQDTTDYGSTKIPNERTGLKVHPIMGHGDGSTDPCNRYDPTEKEIDDSPPNPWDYRLDTSPDGSHKWRVNSVGNLADTPIYPTPMPANWLDMGIQTASTLPLTYPVMPMTAEQKRGSQEPLPVAAPLVVGFGGSTPGNHPYPSSGGEKMPYQAEYYPVSGGEKMPFHIADIYKDIQSGGVVGFKHKRKKIEQGTKNHRTTRKKQNSIKSHKIRKNII